MKKSKGGTIPSNKEDRQEREAWIIAFAAYFCLVCGILIALGEMAGISYHPVLVFGSALFVCAGLWVGRTGGEAWKKVLVWLPVLCFAFFFFTKRVLDEQLHDLLLCLVKMEEGSGDFTLLFVGFSLILSPGCLMLAFIFKLGWMAYGITLFFLLVGPVFGYRPSWIVLGLLGFFHIGNSMYHAVYLKWSDEAREGNTRAVLLQKGLTAGVAVVLAAFFLARLLPAGNRRSWMKDSVQLTQNWSYSWNGKMGFSGSHVHEGPSGKINRGNAHLSGSVQMEVTLPEKPEEEVYLKSFTGKSYLGDAWGEMDETDFYAQFNEHQEKYGNYFEKLKEPYQEYVQENYLRVPEEKLPRLLAFCREHPMEGEEEVTAFIRKTLDEQASYSLTPGFMPYGTDVAEYFLFDGKEGYCQHFATAAALMYRMYGIPARYVAGYRAEPGDFFQREDGQYEARLTGERAHAWVEIYLGGPDWITVEVTPGSQEQTGSGGAGAGSGEGTEEIRLAAGEKGKSKEFSGGEEEFDSLEEELDLQNQGNSSDSEEETGDRKEGRGEAEQEEGQESPVKKVEWLNIIAGALAVILGLLLVFLGAGWILAGIKRKRLKQMGADELYQAMVALMHMGGYLTAFDGTETNFPEEVIRQVADKGGEQGRGHGLTLEEMKRVKSYAFQTAYGPKEASWQETKRVLNAYWKIYRGLTDGERGIKKLKIAVRRAVFWQ